jgi:GNAT superfamily N-acetyltransferase
MDYLPPVREEHVAVIADRIREHEELWLAEEDGRVVGFLGIEASRNLGGAAVLEKLYVEPGEQGRGIGAALLEKAKELRPDGIYLWVFQKNDGARRLYERHGFRLVKLTDGADNMEREPDALYRWP